MPTQMDEVAALKSDQRRHAVRVRVNDAELAFLQRLAERDDRSVSSVLRLALREFYDREMARGDSD